MLEHFCFVELAVEEEVEEEEVRFGSDQKSRSRFLGKSCPLR
jgi:hypothetical protein